MKGLDGKSVLKAPVAVNITSTEIIIVSRLGIPIW